MVNDVEGETSMLMKSGIKPLDDRLGGILPGRSYVLSGAPGTGKSIACLEFLHHALENGGTAAMLTHDDPDDLLAQGEFLGLDLTRALADERLVLLRYQLDFARQFGRSADPQIAFDELARLLGTHVPDRLAIDSVSPFVDAGTASGAGVVALVKFLDQLGATSMLTYPGDLSGRYDRRLEPLSQSAGAILHLSTARDRTGTLEIRKVRFGVPSSAPVSFVIRPGVGFVAAGDAAGRRAEDVPEHTRRKLFVISDGADGSSEMFDVLRGSFDVAIRKPGPGIPELLGRTPVGAVLVDVRRESVDEAVALVRELRRTGSRAPIALITHFRLRSHDRTRALRAGADDFFGSLHPEELVLRVESLVQRGRSAAVVMPEGPRPHPAADGVLDEPAFRGAVDAQIASDGLAFFTVLRLTLPDARGRGDAGDRARLERLAKLAHGRMRADGGDLVAQCADAVTVYLHSARRKDVGPFVERVKEAWRAAGEGEIDVATASYPANESDLPAVLGAQAA